MQCKPRFLLTDLCCLFSPIVLITTLCVLHKLYTATKNILKSYFHKRSHKRSQIIHSKRSNNRKLYAKHAWIKYYHRRKQYNQNRNRSKYYYRHYYGKKYR